MMTDQKKVSWRCHAKNKTEETKKARKTVQQSPKSKSPSADDHEFLTHVALCQLPAPELCSAAWCVGCIPSHPCEHFTAWFCKRWRAASRGPAMPVACLFHFSESPANHSEGEWWVERFGFLTVSVYLKDMTEACSIR